MAQSPRRLAVDVHHGGGVRCGWRLRMWAGRETLGGEERKDSQIGGAGFSGSLGH